MVDGRDIQRRYERFRQALSVSAHGPINTIGVVFDRIVFLAAVGHALAARVETGKCRFYAIGGIIRKGQRYGAGGRKGSQVRVEYAVLADGLLQGIGQRVEGERV